MGTACGRIQLADDEGVEEAVVPRPFVLVIARAADDGSRPGILVRSSPVERAANADRLLRSASADVTHR